MSYLERLRLGKRKGRRQRPNRQGLRRLGRRMMRCASLYGGQREGRGENGKKRKRGSYKESHNSLVKKRGITTMIDGRKDVQLMSRAIKGKGEKTRDRINGGGK